MRVNARFDAEAEQQVTYLAEVTGMGVSEVLRTSVQRYYDAMRAQRSGLKHLSAFVGQGDSGRGDVASTYKKRLTAGWSAKHSGSDPARHAVHEPRVPYKIDQPAGGA
ncbi:MAG: hypothetical protein Q4G71_03560 [Pseudomonadota bacterium]|nr:hypothetical protein [Pseudomonadota bacterium]